MAFDFKKEYKEFYLPKDTPVLVTVPSMYFAAVRGEGDPNEPNGAYQAALSALYAAAYTLKMSKMGDHRIEGYFDYVVPPLEGFWRTKDAADFDPGRKAELRWISVLRLPDFVTPEELTWAKEEAARKKKADCGAVEFLTLE